MITKMLPPSEHFNYHELAEGVWAAIVKPTGLAASNSGIVDLGDRTLVFDTTLSPVSAADLRSAAKNLTGREVTYVLNSHKDFDHVFGNAAFAPETEVYATVRTREIMIEEVEKGILEFKNEWLNLHKNWAESIITAKDEAERLDLKESVEFAQKIIDSFPQLVARLPDHTFTDRLEFTGSKCSVEFITFGGGHTDSDAFLHLPDKRIIFSGDLLVVKNHPGLSSSHPREWLGTLAKIKSLNPVCLVPGHGELATLTDVELIERYLNELLQMTEQNIRQGGTAESAAAMQPPAFTEGWENADSFESNMKFLHEVVRQELQ